MNAAVDILAAGVVVQSLGFTGAWLAFGLAVRKQLRIAAPAKQPAEPKTGTEARADDATATPPALVPGMKDAA